MPVGFFTEIDKLILKLIWELRGPQIAKTVLGKKKKKTEQSWKTYTIQF